MAKGWSLWRWLGVGALGLAGAVFLRRPRTKVPSAPPIPPRPELPLELPEDVSSSWIAGPGGTLRIAERNPEGRLAVLFVHGLGGRSEHWAPLFAALGPALRGIAVDLPGHGKSDADVRGDYSIEALAGSLAAVLDGLGVRRTIVVAHSVGALAAIELAARQPRRVTGLLLVDPSGDQTRLPEAQQRNQRQALSNDPGDDVRWNYRQMLTAARPLVAERVLEAVETLEDEVAAGVLGATLDYSPAAALERYDGPVRMLISERNDLPSSLHNLHPEIPGRFLYGASHWLMMDRPDDVWEELVELLEDAGG